VMTICLTGMTIFAGCNKDNEPELTRQVAVNLRADIKPQSILRAANDQWEANDKVGLYMKKTGQALTATGAVYSGVSNVLMSISGQTLTSNPPIMYPTSGNVDFVGYYPYTSSVDNDYTIAVNVAGQSDGLPVEVLYSNNVTNQAPTESAVVLNFQYSLAKLELTVTGGANSKLTATDFADMTVSIEGMYTQAKLQLTNGTFANRQNKQIITLYKTGNTATSATFEALVLPTTVADGELTFVFNVAGKTYRNEMTANYAAANLYKLNFAIDFPSFPEQTATLLNAVIIPRNENSQNFSVDASLQMIMTSEAPEVTFHLAGTGKMTIDWGNGSPNETHMLSYNGTYPSYTYSYSGTSTRTITIIGEDIWYLNCGFNPYTGIFYNNQITSLDVSKNTALTYLGCDSNQLTKLDVSKNIALTYLNCGWNKLTSLNVSKNIALTNLSFNNNQLTESNVGNNTALTYINCGDNKLTSLDVSKNVVLTYLGCYSNQLMELDVNKNTALTQLVCGDNLMTSSALNILFETLHNNAGKKSITINGNIGVDGCNKKIAEDKGWTVD